MIDPEHTGRVDYDFSALKEKLDKAEAETGHRTVFATEASDTRETPPQNPYQAQNGERSVSSAPSQASR